jgi:hypothetical protein
MQPNPVVKALDEVLQIPFQLRERAVVLRRKSVQTEIGNPVTFCNVR